MQLGFGFSIIEYQGKVRTVEIPKFKEFGSLGFKPLTLRPL